VPNKSPKTILALVVSLLILSAWHSLVQAKPSINDYNRKTYDNFVERLVVDFKKAGFAVSKGEVESTPFRQEEPVIEVEIKVLKISDGFAKYFGKLKLNNFFIQGEERKDGRFSIYLWVRYGISVNYIIFSYQDSSFADFEQEIGKAKQEIINYLFGFDCGTQYYGGLIAKPGSKFTSVSVSSASSFVQNRSKDFSQTMREFLSNFYRELKTFGFRFTLVENFPVSEIRVFGFPKDISIFLPEPETKLVAVRSKISGGAELIDIDVFDRKERKFNTVSIINLSSGDSMKKMVELAIEKIFYNFYTPDCSGYGGM